MFEHEAEYPGDPQPVSLWQARAWMAWTLLGVLLSCLVAFILAPVRAIVTD